MKLIPLFCSDLRDLELKTIAARIVSGYQVLALDVKVLLFCVQNKIPYTCIEKWVDRETIYQCTVLAHHFEKQWFMKYRHLFLISGVCFPELDGEAMFHFWRETLVAGVFMEIFLNKGGSDIFIPCNRKAPSVYYYRADTWKTVIENYLSANRYTVRLLDRIRAFAGELKMVDSIFGDKRFEQAKGLKENPETNDGHHCADREKTSPKIAIAINPGEIGRFKAIIQKMEGQRWAHTAVYLTTHDRQYCENLSEQWGIRFRPVPKPDLPTGQLAERLYNAYCKTREDCFALLEHAVTIDYHFKHYCKHRWPALYTMYRGWQTLWAHERPTVAIGSLLPDAESRLPFVAANHFGITTVGLPHARFQSINSNQSSRYILYDFLPFRNDLEKTGIHPERLIGCRDVLGTHPYPTYRKVAVERKSCNILALVGNINGVTEEGNLFTPRVLSLAQIEALKWLANPPDELKDLVQIKYKVHPKGAEMEMFELAGIDCKEDLLPLDSDLNDALNSFDLVVDINNTGTAVLTAIQREMPLLICWNGLVKRVNYNVEVLLESGESIANGRDFWHCVARILHDPSYRDLLVNKSKSFRDRYLDTDRYPTIERIIQQRLTENGDPDCRVDSWNGAGRPAVAAVKIQHAHTDRPPTARSADLLGKIARNPGDVETLVDLAHAAAGEDNPDDGLAFLEEALMLDPAHGRALSLRNTLSKRPGPHRYFDRKNHPGGQEGDTLVFPRKRQPEEVRNRQGKRLS